MRACLLDRIPDPGENHDDDSRIGKIRGERVILSRLTIGTCKHLRLGTIFYIRGFRDSRHLS